MQTTGDTNGGHIQKISCLISKVYIAGLQRRPKACFGPLPIALCGCLACMPVLCKPACCCKLLLSLSMIEDAALSGMQKNLVHFSEGDLFHLPFHFRRLLIAFFSSFLYISAIPILKKSNRMYIFGLPLTWIIALRKRRFLIQCNCEIGT